MTEPQRLYLVQARSDFRLFNNMLLEKTIHHCHALHYLQMATEKLGKATWKKGPTEMSHCAIVRFLRNLSSNKKARKQLGYEGKSDAWAAMLNGMTKLAEQIEDLAPALAVDKPNPEYPWPRIHPTHAPIEFEFPIWNDLTKEAQGREFLKRLAALFDAAEAYL